MSPLMAFAIKCHQSLLVSLNGSHCCGQIEPKGQMCSTRFIYIFYIFLDDLEPLTKLSSAMDTIDKTCSLTWSICVSHIWHQRISHLHHTLINCWGIFETIWHDTVFKQSYILKQSYVSLYMLYESSTCSILILDSMK